MKWIFLTTALLSSSVMAKTGNELLAECTSGEGADWAKCYGYIEGVNDAIRFSVIVSRMRGTPSEGISAILPYYCIPDGVTMGQAADIIVQHLRATPEDRHKNAAGYVYSAFIDTFPCE